MELSPIEYCTRHKVRFASGKGMLSIEDLWDLPLTSETGKPNLNDAAKAIHATLKTDDTNFVETESSSPASVENRIILEAIKRVIAIKQDERKAATSERERKTKKQELMAALEVSEGKALASKSPEEIRAMLAAL